MDLTARSFASFLLLFVGVYNKFDFTITICYKNEVIFLLEVIGVLFRERQKYFFPSN